MFWNKEKTGILFALVVPAPDDLAVVNDTSPKLKLPP
jgi:hypothetical protein